MTWGREHVENDREISQAHPGSQCPVGAGKLQGGLQELDFKYSYMKFFQPHPFMQQIAMRRSIPLDAILSIWVTAVNKWVRLSAFGGLMFIF